MLLFTQGGGFGDSCLGFSPAVLSTLQVGLGLLKGSISLLDAGCELLSLALGLLDGGHQSTLAILAVAHELVEQNLFLLAFLLNLLVHALQHVHHTTDRVCSKA